MLIDSHVHLDMREFRDDREAVLGRAREAGVGEMLNVGYDPRSLEATLEIIDRYEPVFGAIGIHPHHATDWSGDLESALKQALLRRKVLAAGEMGLDFYRDLSPRDAQRDVFRKQIGIALYFKKPIIIHSREAFPEVIDILHEEGAGEVGGIFHAFSGGPEEAERVLELGFLIGIGGPLTYRKSRLPEVACHIRSSAFVLETDCPYLPPEPYRGRRNEPAYVAIVRDRLAEILGVDPADVERASEVNYRRLLHGDQSFPPRIAYPLKGNLYINVTATCTNRCVFCHRERNDDFLFGHNLNLIADPSVEEMLEAARAELAGEASSGADASGAGAAAAFGEIVFCGYGEPTCRERDIIKVGSGLSTLGLPLRLDTNGLGNLINQRNIVPELEQIFQRVSVSLNAPDRETYLKLCRPDAGERAFEAVLDFLRKAAASRMECTATVLDHPAVDVAKAKALVEGIPGAKFRVRRYHA